MSLFDWAFRGPTGTGPVSTAATTGLPLQTVRQDRQTSNGDNDEMDAGSPMTTTTPMSGIDSESLSSENPPQSPLSPLFDDQTMSETMTSQRQQRLTTAQDRFDRMRQEVIQTSPFTVLYPSPWTQTLTILEPTMTDITALLQSPQAGNWQSLMRTIQSHPLLRLQWYERLRNCIVLQSGFTQARTMNEIENNYVELEEVLGSGTYGIVYGAMWRQQNCSPLPIAVKIAVIDEDSIHDRESIEARRTESSCNEAANMLVWSGMCPHFLLYFGSVIVTGPRMRLGTNRYARHYQYTLFEYATGSIKSWLESTAQPRTCMQLFSIYFQTLIGIYTMAREFQMVNNDLYTRNVLYNDVDPAYYRYQIHIPPSSTDGRIIDAAATTTTTASIRTYVIHNAGLLIKLSDFGLCALPGRYSTQFATTPFRSRSLLYADRVRRQPTTHVLFLDLPRYARDLLAFTHSMIVAIPFYECRPMRAFLIKIETHVSQRIIHDPTFLRTPDDLGRLLDNIFSDQFMNAPLRREVGWTQ